jgi:hypothetical protein
MRIRQVGAAKSAKYYELSCIAHVSACRHSSGGRANTLLQTPSSTVPSPRFIKARVTAYKAAEVYGLTESGMKCHNSITSGAR